MGYYDDIYEHAVAVARGGMDAYLWGESVIELLGLAVGWQGFAGRLVTGQGTAIQR